MALKSRLRCAAARSSRCRLSIELLLVGAAAEGAAGQATGYVRQYRRHANAGCSAVASLALLEHCRSTRPGAGMHRGTGQACTGSAPGRRGGRCSWLGVWPSSSSAASLLLPAEYNGWGAVLLPELQHKQCRVAVAAQRVHQLSLSSAVRTWYWANRAAHSTHARGAAQPLL